MRGWEGTMKWGSCSNWLGLGLNLKHDKTTGWRINLNSFRRFLGQKYRNLGPSCSSSFSTCCPILGSLQFCPGREWTGSSLSYALNKRHSSGERGMAEETWPTKSLVGHCVITTTRKWCWPRLEAKNTRTSSTFKNLSDSMDIEVYHLSLFISPLETANTWFPPLRPTIVMHFQPVIPSEVLSTI